MEKESKWSYIESTSAKWIERQNVTEVYFWFEVDDFPLLNMYLIIENMINRFN